MYPTSLTNAEAAEFWTRVTRTTVTGCWEWTGGTGEGYGSCKIGRRRLRAHRVSYTLLRGPISSELVLDHLCRNRLCVNPRHLEPVPTATNIRRGDGWAGTNARKDSCPAGHPYDEANTRIYVQRGKRHLRCRECDRIRHQQSRAVGGRQRPECPRGHPYDLANTYVSKRGSRNCRKCAAEYQRTVVRPRLAAEKAGASS